MLLKLCFRFKRFTVPCVDIKNAPNVEHLNTPIHKNIVFLKESCLREEKLKTIENMILCFLMMQKNIYKQ